MVTNAYGNHVDTDDVEAAVNEGDNGNEIDYMSDDEIGNNFYGRAMPETNRKVTDDGYVTDGYQSAGEV